MSWKRGEDGKRFVTLLAGNDLDDMEREILERYYKRQWFTSWQLNMLQAVEALQLGRSHLSVPKE